ncbi:MAG: SRPBCC domain-containing protein [Phenylobacterium sp.]
MADITVTHRYRHPPETVFDAWLDAAVARRFLFATPTGEMIRAEVDARVGGRFTFVDRRPDMGDVLHTGEYLEIDRPRRLVFTFGVPQYEPGFTRVEIEITPADGGCEVRLTQRDTPDEWIAQSQKGWSMILASLEAGLGG